MPGSNGRTYVKYNFFKVMPEWRRLPQAERSAGKEEFAAVIDEFEDQMFTRSFSLVGLRGDTDFLLWQASPEIETLQDVATRLWSTKLGAYLTQPYSYLAMTRKSPYVGGHRHEGQEGVSHEFRPGNAPYFVVYPFTKTTDWYALPREDRQKMMSQHFEIGHKYPNVKINTTYSFGLDDQEFVVAFETDSPADFLDLVEEMRGSAARPYTLEDTPIFTCIHRPLKETLDSLGG